jgi:hypothetical protein
MNLDFADHHPQLDSIADINATNLLRFLNEIAKPPPQPKSAI